MVVHFLEHRPARDAPELEVRFRVGGGEEDRRRRRTLSLGNRVRFRARRVAERSREFSGGG